MPKDVIITPANSYVEFRDTNSNVDAMIYLDNSRNLNIQNPNGSLTFGNTAANVYIGDGTSVVDIIFEQNGSVRALTGKTLTLGQSDSSVAFAGNVTNGFRVTSGNVGIGTTTPAASLQVVGGAIMPAAGNSATAGIQFPSDPGGGSGDRAYIRYFARTGESMTLLLGMENDADDHIAAIPGGNFGVGLIDPSSKLHVVGNANITTSINTATVNATTINAQTFVTSTGANVYAAAVSAYGQANAAYGQANAAYTQANTATTNAGNAYGQANAAYTQANTATTNAGNAYGQANAAYGQANAAYTQANAAYGQANAAYGQANAAYTQANAAYGQANAAYGQANSAFTAANNRVLKAGDTMTGQLNISSGGLLVTGNVGIGIASPTSALHVTGAANVSANLTVGAGSNTAPSITTTGDNDTGIFFPAADTVAITEGGTEVLRVTSTSNVAIGTTAASYKVDVTGDIRASGNMISVSDLRTKQNVQTIGGALKKVVNLRGVYFNRIGSNTKHIGVIAQEVNEILPEVVSYTENEDRYSVAYGNMVGILIEAIKEQNEKIVELENKLNQIKTD